MQTAAAPGSRSPRAWRPPELCLAVGSWQAPDLPLYGDDHDRADFAP